MAESPARGQLAPIDVQRANLQPELHQDASLHDDLPSSAKRDFVVPKHKRRHPAEVDTVASGSSELSSTEDDLQLDGVQSGKLHLEAPHPRLSEAMLRNPSYRLSATAGGPHLSTSNAPHNRSRSHSNSSLHMDLHRPESSAESDDNGQPESRTPMRLSWQQVRSSSRISNHSAALPRSSSRSRPMSMTLPPSPDTATPTHATFAEPSRDATDSRCRTNSHSLLAGMPLQHSPDELEGVENHSIQRKHPSRADSASFPLSAIGTKARIPHRTLSHAPSVQHSATTRARQLSTAALPRSHSERVIARPTSAGPSRSATVTSLSEMSGQQKSVTANGKGKERAYEDEPDDDRLMMEDKRAKSARIKEQHKHKRRRAKSQDLSRDVEVWSKGPAARDHDDHEYHSPRRRGLEQEDRLHDRRSGARPMSDLLLNRQQHLFPHSSSSRTIASNGISHMEAQDRQTTDAASLRDLLSQVDISSALELVRGAQVAVPPPQLNPTTAVSSTTTSSAALTPKSAESGSISSNTPIITPDSTKSAESSNRKRRISLATLGLGSHSPEASKGRPRGLTVTRVLSQTTNPPRTAQDREFEGMFRPFSCQIPMLMVVDRVATPSLLIFDAFDDCPNERSQGISRKPLPTGICCYRGRSETAVFNRSQALASAE